MSGWEAEILDAIYADPPYNASHAGVSLPKNKTGGAYHKINESWDRFDAQDYFLFTERWVRAGHRLLKQSGSLLVACSLHNIGETIHVAKRCGFKLNNIIVWRKTNAMPNITKRTFTHTTEYTCWFVKGSGWTFNYHELKAYNPQKTKTGDLKQMPDFLELPIVQGKERLRNGDGRALHPAQKPEKLIEMLLVATTNPGDLVLDPFMGAGTTAVVAERLGRKWLGIEINRRYAKAAERRLCQARA